MQIKCSMLSLDQLYKNNDFSLKIIFRATNILLFKNKKHTDLLQRHYIIQKKTNLLELLAEFIPMLAAEFRLDGVKFLKNK